jgi:probable HAF family extracellular repeat protein
VAIFSCISHSFADDVIDLGALRGGEYYGPQFRLGINNRDQVTGNVTVPGTIDAALYSDGGILDLGVLLGSNTNFSQSEGISDSGQVVGYFGFGNTDATFVYRDGTFTEIGAPGSITVGFAINNSGEVTGILNNSAFLYSKGNIVSLGAGNGSAGNAINDSGQVVGRAYNGAFLYDNGTISYLGAHGSDAIAINASGQVTGFDGVADAFLYSNGTMIDLGNLGGQFSFGLGINNRGEVVGTSMTGAGSWSAFLYKNGTMSDITPAGWSNTRATGINDRGDIVGYGTNPQGQQHAFLLRRTP